MTTETTKELITNQQKEAIKILIQSVQIATKNGAFDLDEALIIGNAKNITLELLK